MSLIAISAMLVHFTGCFIYIHLINKRITALGFQVIYAFWIINITIQQIKKQFQFQFNNHGCGQILNWKNDDIIPNWIVTVFPGTMSNSCSMKKKLFNQNQSEDKDLIFVIGPRSFVIKRCKLEPHNWNSIDVKLECLYLLLSTL